MQASGAQIALAELQSKYDEEYTRRLASEVALANCQPTHRDVRPCYSSSLFGRALVLSVCRRALFVYLYPLTHCGGQEVALLRSEIHQLKAEVLQWKTAAQSASLERVHMAEQEQKQLSRLRNLYVA